MKMLYNVVNQYNLLYKGSECFDRPRYWMSAICLALLWKTAELRRCRTAPHSLFTSDVMKKSMFKRLGYTPPDLSPRLTCKVNLSNTKNRAWFLLGCLCGPVINVCVEKWPPGGGKTRGSGTEKRCSHKWFHRIFPCTDPCTNTFCTSQKALRTWRRLFALFEAIRS